MNVLHDKVDALSGNWAVYTFIQPHHLGMIQLAEYFDFPESRFLPLYVHQLETVINFDGDSFSCGLMKGLLDNGICTVPDLLA